MTIQVKAIKQYFPVVLFIILYKVVLTFESVDEILVHEKGLEVPFHAITACHRQFVNQRLQRFIAFPVIQYSFKRRYKYCFQVKDQDTYNTK